MSKSLVSELQEMVERAAERVGPSVVGLGRGWGRGSGVVHEPGRVLTCAHVLRGDEVAVTFGDGRTADGRVAGADPDLDLAVVAVDTGDAPAVAWEPERAGTLGHGSPVLALADPSGRGLRVTFGLVSATGRSFRGPGGRRAGGSIEHTAPLPRGSSGGPLVDPGGHLLGLNAVRREGGLILAVPADEAVRGRAAALARGEATGRPRLGVALAPPRHARRIRSAAGLQRGDLIVRAGGRAVTSVDDLFDALDAAAGGALALGLVRGAEERELEVTLE